MTEPTEDEVIYPRVVVKLAVPEDEDDSSVVIGGIEFSQVDPDEEDNDAVYTRLGYVSDLPDEVVQAFCDTWQARAAKIGVPFDNEIPAEEDVEA